MNNYWFTNYKADQEGPTTFRYSLEPHGLYDQARAIQFGIERSQPLVTVRVEKNTPAVPSFLKVTPTSVIASSLKPRKEDDGWTLRLFGASGKPEKAQVELPGSQGWKVYRSNLDGGKGELVKGSFDVAPYEMVTLRIEEEQRSAY